MPRVGEYCETSLFGLGFLFQGCYRDVVALLVGSPTTIWVPARTKGLNQWLPHFFGCWDLTFFYDQKMGIVCQGPFLKDRPREENLALTGNQTRVSCVPAWLLSGCARGTSL